jgi:hypothetical protein
MREKSQRVSSILVRYKNHSSSIEVWGRSSTINFNEGISHSIDNTASIPYTNWKGVNLVVVLTKVQ